MVREFVAEGSLSLPHLDYLQWTQCDRRLGLPVRAALTHSHPLETLPFFLPICLATY